MVLDASGAPAEAVAEARSRGESGEPGAFEALDRELRKHVLRCLQDGEGGEAIEDALEQAAWWARARGETSWRARWEQLLELLEDGRELPSRAADLHALAPTGRAAEVLQALARLGGPVRRDSLREAVGVSQAHLSNLLGKLEKAGHVTRRKGAGREVWVLLAPRGREVLSLLPERQVTVAAKQQAEPVPLWNTEALYMPVAAEG